jgi:hypothetical protein
MRRRLSGFAAAVLVAAAAYATGLGATSAAATASGCSSGEGVTVVVDFHDLGGGLQQTCDAEGGGRDGASLFVRAGYQLTPVQKQPAFVCRINGVPADDPCVNTPPADAYWALWWSDGTDGRWSYSTVAASGLKIPDGGYVAFSWNRGSGQDKPGTTPKAHVDNGPTAAPTPKSSPTPKPSQTPAPPATTSVAPSSAAPTPSPSESPTKSTSPRPSRKPKPSTHSDAPPTAPQSSSPSGAQDDEVIGTATFTDEGRPVPTWAVLLVVGALFAGAASIAVVRRRRHDTRPGP